VAGPVRDESWQARPYFLTFLMSLDLHLPFLHVHLNFGTVGLPVPGHVILQIPSQSLPPQENMLSLTAELQYFLNNFLTGGHWGSFEGALALEAPIHLIWFFFKSFHSNHLQVLELHLQFISDFELRDAPSLHFTRHLAPFTGAPLSQSSVTGGMTEYNWFRPGHWRAGFVVVGTGTVVVVTAGSVGCNSEYGVLVHSTPF